MQELKIYIPMKPVSVNNLRQVSRNRIINSREANSFKKHCALFLLKYSEEIRTFLTHEPSKKIAMSFNLTFLIPEKELLTGKLEISKKSGDIDNFVKICTDSAFQAFNIFSKKLDDAQIIDMNLKKRVSPANEYGFIISAQFVDINKIHSSD